MCDLLYIYAKKNKKANHEFKLLFSAANHVKNILTIEKHIFLIIKTGNYEKIQGRIKIRINKK
jgi:hypothetical protein